MSIAEALKKKPTKTGFVGLGNIGKPMALRLAASEAVDLQVFDIAPEPVAELVAAGAKEAASIAQMANSVDVICVMVRDDAQVRDVLEQAMSELRPRNDMLPVQFVVHSTISPETPEALREIIAKTCGFAFQVVDAPVSGGPMGAADGSLAIMVGADEWSFERIQPVLDVMGSKVIHAGDVGAGTKFKLARNLLHFASFTAATEAQRLAEAAGLDPAALGDVVRHTDKITGGPGAIMYRATTAPIPEDDFWFGVFSHVRALGEKDLRHAIELAEQLDVDVPFARLALDRLGTGLGLPEEH